MNEQVKIAVVVDRPRISAQAEGRVVAGWDVAFLVEKAARAGICERNLVFLSAHDPVKLLERLEALPNLAVIVPLGEKPLQIITGLKSITKWHLSPLDTLPQFTCRKAIPTFHPDDVRKDFGLALYVERTFRRAASEMHSREFTRKPKKFLLNPDLKETFDVLDYLEKLSAESWLSVDIETGRGLINTVGFAWSAGDAIAIQTLPSRLVPESFHDLWTRIGRILRGPSKKVMQNGIYETLYFARYGCEIRNFAHDTMHAQKFLWPEFEKGLDSVGRFYTNEPYWKDTGRVEAAEGKRKDWGDIRDWTRHLTYNCLDTSGTYEAMINQREDLKARGKLDFFDNYLMQLHPIMTEMCLRGLPVCETTRTELVAQYEDKIAELSQGLSMTFTKAKKQVSAITRAQKMLLLRDKGYEIPKVRDKTTGKIRESVDELSLKKLLQKHPDDTDIPKLLKIAEFEKALSSYFRVELDPFDSRVRFMMDICATETGRWNSTTDPWGRGLNAQTVPKYAKGIFKWT